MEERFPQYIHLPLQVLWFDTTELFILFIAYLVGMLFGGVAWIGLIVGPLFLIPYKRRQARGHFGHLLYLLGFAKLKGYPLPTAKEFYE